MKNKSKAREFWIDKDSWHVFTSEPNYLLNIYHAIEMSAYRTLEEDLRFYKYELESRSQLAEATKQDWLEAMDKIGKLESRCAKLKVALELALSFAPKGPVPPGLDPTFYHTLNYEEECKLQTRIDEARAALAEDEGAG